MDRLRRVTDLFVEGTELFLGMDDEQKPVVLWINKLNSFEIEEARRDGVAARGLRLLELTKEDNPERLAITHQLGRWDDEKLRQYRVGQMSDELYLNVINDLEADEEWAEKLPLLRRLPQLLDDENAPEDDPRREQLGDLNTEYLDVLRVRSENAQKAALKELKDVSRKDLEEDYLEAWRNRISLDEFMAERRMTEIFAAVRDCRATEAAGATGGKRWDHSRCDHTERLLNARSAVKTLPEPVIEKIVDTLEDLTVPQRDSGNSDAPASSSASLGPSSAPEAPSTPSSPAETPLAVPTT